MIDIETLPYLDVILGTDSSAQVFRSKSFRDDALLFVSIPDEQLAEVVSVLRASDGFIGPSALKKIVTEHVTDTQQRSALSKFVTYFARNRRQRKSSDLEQYQAQLTEEIGTQLRGRLPDEALDVLLGRLPAVLLASVGVDRQLKAEDLVRKTGRRLASLEVISDIRPVFDETRTKIEGMVPLTTLYVVSAGSASAPQTTEFVLSEKQLKDLADKTARALSKLQTIKAHLKATNLSLPESPMTTEDADG